MRKSIALLLSVAFPLVLAPVSQAENLTHLQQLLSTKQCTNCDLTGAGLVQAQLAGARLTGANLAGANLSQSNLSGADLSGANLSGASLFGANLTGANLKGAILNGTDLRGAYLVNSDLGGTKLDNAYVQGAVGIPANAGSPELFYSWGMAEAKQGNTAVAIGYFNQALALNPDFAPAYLARAMAYFRTGQNGLAASDAKSASDLFEKQQNQAGYEASQNFIKGMEIALQPKKEEQGNPQLDSLVQGIGSLLLQFVLPSLGLF
jgi:uncharacterized protein YjbI with pentapeptide repeats